MTTTANAKSPVKFVYKPLSRSIQEISKLLNLLKASDEETEGVLGIAITAAAIRMIEGIINTIISSIPVHEKLKGSFEKMQIVERLDLCLYLRVHKPLDRGHHSLGYIAQMIKDRNGLTHPYPIESEFQSVGYDTISDTVRFETKKNPYEPKVDEVKERLRIIFEFLDAYLLDWCKCDAEFLSLLMSETVHFSDGTTGILQSKNLTLSKSVLETELSIKIKFLDYIKNV